MAIQQNPNWPVLFVKGIGAMAVSDGTNVLGINADGSINISGTIVTTPTSPQVIAGNVGLVTGSHIIVDSMPPISVTATTSSPTIVSGNVGLVPGSVLDIIDRAARQLGHVVVDSQPALSLSSPTVVAGDVTIHGTADIIDRAMRQLGLVAFTVPQHVVVDSQPAFSLSSPTVIVGDVTTHGTTDVQDRVARQLGHVIVDSQPALSLSSPTVIAGDVTIHGTADVQDRIARQLGHVLLDTSPIVVIGRVGADIGSTGGLALDSTLTGGQQKTLVTNFPATQPVSGTISLSSPAVIAGDVTTHGTVDVQDRVARQLGIVSLSTSPIIVLGTVTTNIGDPGLLARDATLTGGQQKTLITNFPATQPVSGTISLSSPAVVAGDVTVHGTVDVQDRAARQLGIATAQQLTGLNLHINIDNSPAVSQLASSSPWVVGGTVTTQGTTDVQDRITRQLGHVLLDSSPVIIGGDVTVHGLVDMQDRVARQMGHVIVDSQPPFSLSSPTVIAGDATVHGTIDVQDRGARQLGHVLIDNPAANPVQVSFVPSSTQAVTQSTSPWVVAGDVTIHGTTDVQDRVARQLGHVIVDSQPAFTLASPSIMGGDVTVHGTIDMQDRVARQVGHVLIDSSSANPVSVTFAPSSTQAVTQSTSPWVIAGDANIHGTVDVQDRVARQLGHVLLDSSPVIIGGDVSIHGTTDIQDRTTRQLGHVLIDNPAANPVQVSFVPSSTQAVTQSTSPWVIAGDANIHGIVDVQDRLARQLGHVIVDSQPALSLSSPTVVAGDVTIHGLVDIQDRVARQLGIVSLASSPVVVVFAPTSTQAVTQSTSPWVVAGDVTTHGTVDVQDRIARQLGHILVDSQNDLLNNALRVNVVAGGLIGQGTALNAGNFVLTGWGAGAAISSVQGTDQAWSATITAGTTPSVNPAIQVNFHNGVWSTAPICLSKVNGGTGTITDLTDNPSISNNIITFLGTPVNGLTYIILSQANGTSTGAGAVTQATSPWTIAGTATVQQPLGLNLHVNIDNSPAVSQLASSSPWVVGGTVTTQGTTDVQDRVARQLGHVIIDSQPALVLSSPTVVAGDVTIHGTTDVQDRGARQLGHVLVDNTVANPVQVSFVPSSTQAVTQSTSPWVIVGDATIHGTVDVQDRVIRQLGHVIVDSQPALTLSSPTVVAGDVTVHGLVDVQDRVSRQIGHVIVDSQPALTLSSPTVVAGDVTVHGTTDIQDRVARQLGIVTAQQLTGLNLHVNIDNSPAVSQLASSSPWVIGGNVGLVPGTTIVATQPNIAGSSPWVVTGNVDASGSQVIIRSGVVSIQGTVPIAGVVPVSQPAGSSPWIIAGDTTIHGTVDIQDRAGRQLGNLTSPIVIGTLPSINIGATGGLALDSTLTGGQAKVNIQGTVPVTGTLSLTSPSVVAGDMTVHGTIDIQDRAARQLGNLTSPVVIGTLPSINIGATGGLALDSTLTGGQAKTIVSGVSAGVSIAVTQPAAASPWVVTGNVDASGSGVIIRSGQISVQGPVSIAGTVPVSQPAGSSPWVIAGDATVHGTIDIQDRAARQLGITTAQSLTGLGQHVNIDNSPAVGQLSTSSPWVVGGNVGLVPGTVVVAQQPNISGSSPWVVTGRVDLSAETTKVIGTVRNVGNVGGVFDAATAAATPANALAVGYKAAVANPTAVAVGQLVNPLADILGKLVVRLNANRERIITNTITLSATTETTLIAAGAAGVFRDLTHLVITNTSATAVRVDIRDVTAGTVRQSYAIAANGGAVIPLDTAWPQTTAASAWTAQLSAAVTDIRINAMAIETV